MLTNVKNPRQTTESRGCLRRYGGSEHAQVRLVCFPWAGAGASVYRRFVYHLPDSIELFSAQYPGREDRYNEPHFLRMEDIVRHIVNDIHTLIDHRPIVFFGHSMGSLVAYEVAQRLNNLQAWEPDLLVVSGSGSPENESTYERCPGYASDQCLIEEMQRLGGTPKAILDDPQIMKTFLPVIRADYEVLDNYNNSFDVPLSCPIITCAGDEDTSVSHKTLDMWSQYTSGRCRQFMFSGDHFYLTSTPLPLIKHLSRWILPEKEGLYSELSQCI